MTKIGGNGVEGTFNKDMSNDEMTLEAPLSQTCDHIWRASVRSEKCACVRTVRCCLYKGYIVHVGAGFLYTCNETCEMNVCASCTASQNPQNL